VIVGIDLKRNWSWDNTRKKDEKESGQAVGRSLIL
jgi:hypothetical protein